MLNRLEGPSINADHTLSRKTSGSVLTERTLENNENMHTNQGFPSSSEPFKLQIDTHTIHRDMGPPGIHNVATFNNQQTPSTCNLSPSRR